MNRLAAASMVCLLSALGCTDNYSVIITKNAPSDDECTADIGGDNNMFRGRGALDVTSPLPNGTLNGGYVLTPVAESGLIGVSQTNGNPNGHLAFIMGAQVEVRSDGTDASNRLVAALEAVGLEEREERFTASVGPGGTAGLAFLALDSRQTQVLNSVIEDNTLVVVVTRSTLFGNLDGDDFESLPFDYPITLCRGCLIQNVGRCDAFVAATPFDQGGVCSPTQDEVLSCCVSTTGATLCPAIGQMPDPTDN